MKERSTSLVRRVQEEEAAGAGYERRARHEAHMWKGSRTRNEERILPSIQSRLPRATALMIYLITWSKKMESLLHHEG